MMLSESIALSPSWLPTVSKTEADTVGKKYSFFFGQEWDSVHVDADL